MSPEKGVKGEFSFYIDRGEKRIGRGGKKKERKREHVVYPKHIHMIGPE